MVTVVSLSSSQQRASEFCSKEAELIPHSHFYLSPRHIRGFYIHFSGKEGKEENYVKKQLSLH